MNIVYKPIESDYYSEFKIDLRFNAHNVETNEIVGNLRITYDDSCIGTPGLRVVTKTDFLKKEKRDKNVVDNIINLKTTNKTLEEEIQQVQQFVKSENRGYQIPEQLLSLSSKDVDDDVKTDYEGIHFYQEKDLSLYNIDEEYTTETTTTRLLTHEISQIFNIDKSLIK